MGWHFWWQEAAVVATRAAQSSLMPSMDEEELTAEQQQCLTALREGKRLLKERQGSSAMVRFEKALMLAKSLGEKIYERRATRGLAAAARLQVRTQILHAPCNCMVLQLTSRAHA